MNPKYLKGIVTYKYYTGTKFMEDSYRIPRHLHGPFDCDMEDFKKFFDQIKDGGEVSELFLICKKGCYHWDQTVGWMYFGR